MQKNQKNTGNFPGKFQEKVDKLLPGGAGGRAPGLGGPWGPAPGALRLGTGGPAPGAIGKNRIFIKETIKYSGKDPPKNTQVRIPAKIFR